MSHKKVIKVAFLLLYIFNNTNGQNYKNIRGKIIENELIYTIKINGQQVFNDKNNDKVSTKMEFSSKSYNSDSYFLLNNSFNFGTNLKKIEVEILKNRIKFIKGDINVDTDVPFATDEKNKMNLDEYLSQIKNPKKIVVELDGKVSESTLEYNLSRLPLLNKISEFSGILMNITKDKIELKAWADSLTNENDLYINNYQIKNLNGNKATILVNGKLNKKMLQIFKDDYDIEKAMANNSLKAETIINSWIYEGEIKVNLDSDLIEELSLDAFKDYTLNLMGQKLNKKEQINYLMKSKVKK